MTCIYTYHVAWTEYGLGLHHLTDLKLSEEEAKLYDNAKWLSAAIGAEGFDPAYEARFDHELVTVIKGGEVVV